MLTQIYKKFGQGILVTGCSITSFITLGWLMTDVHRIELNKTRTDYEKQIKELNNEINNLKLENAVSKMNYIH